MHTRYSPTELAGRRYRLNQQTTFTVEASIEMINRMNRCLDDVGADGIRNRRLTMRRDDELGGVRISLGNVRTQQDLKLYQRAFQLARHSLGRGDELTVCDAHLRIGYADDCWLVTIHDAIRGIHCPLAPIKE